MKYIVDLTSLDDHFSGIERYAFCMTKEMLRQDQRNAYLLIFKNKVPEGFETYRSQKNVKFQVLKGRSRLLVSQVALPAFLWKTKADRFLFFAFPSPILFRKKGIYNTIHDMGAWDVPFCGKNLPRIYFKISYFHAAKVSEGILTVSHFSKDRIAEILKYEKRRIHVLPSAIADTFRTDCTDDDEKFPEVQKRYHLPDQYILCLSTLEPRKNMDLLVDTYGEVMRKVDYDLVLVGRTGWKVEKLLEKISAMGGRVHLTGFVADKDLPCIYKHAKCFVFPSLYEGFGLPPLEALSVNVPVISSDAASLPEVLGEQAVYFHCGDEKDLEEKLENLDSVLEGRHLGLSQYQIENFSFPRSAAKLLNILDESGLS